jgi:hypothetical protein
MDPILLVVRCAKQRSSLGFGSFTRPVPIVARVVWAHDGEEYIDTVAAGWSGQNVYVRLPDPRYRLTSVWLNAADVRRR